MPRAKRQGDEEEASASFSVPTVDDGNNLTPFERETLARNAEEKRLFRIAESKRKAQDARIESDLVKVRMVLSGKVRALLAEHYKDEPAADDIVSRMMRDIDPILAAGKDGRRRERGKMYHQPPKAVVAP